MKKVKLGQLVSIQTGKLDANAAVFGGKYPFFTTAKEISRINEYAYDGEVVLVAGNGDLNVKYYKGKFNAYQRTYILTSKSNLRMKYLYYFLDKYIEVLRYQSIGGVIKYIKLNNLSDAQIPMRSIFEQDKIIGILEKLDNEIIIRSKQLSELSNLVKSRFNEMFGDPVLNEMGWEKHALKEFGIWKSGGTPKRNEEKYFRGHIPWITSGELEHKYIDDSFEKITEKAIECSSAKIIEKGSLLLGMYDTAGLKSSINTKVMSCNQAIAFAKLDDKITNTIYVYYVIQNLRSMLLNQQRGVRQKNFNLSMIKNISIPLPPLSLQNEFADFVAQVDKSQLAIQKSLEELETLKKSLMQEYFG